MHRYVGVLLAPFLILVGSTGSLLAFYQELDRALNPALLAVPLSEAPLLDPFILREWIEQQEPQARMTGLT
jgi:uncharacterized iron-regulated membrane protein